jgi:hypothetical protein
MKNIVFSSNLIPLIERGQKTQTIRKWKTCSLQKGDQILLGRKIPARVTYCYQTTFGNLTSDEAQKDGFDTIENLQYTLLRFYPYLVSSDILWVIGFSLDH